MRRFGTRGALADLCGLALAGGALAAGLSSGDSLITLGYLNNTYIPQTVEDGAEQADEALTQVYEQAVGQLDDLADDYLSQVGVGTEGSYSAAYVRQTLSMGDEITLEAGSGLLLEAGTLTVNGGTTLVDVTDGAEVAAGARLTAGHRYLAAEGQVALTVDSGAARLALQGSYQAAAGSGADMPFTDVSTYDWYCSAVAGAYARGLFAGTGDGSTFSPDISMNRAMMMTVLFHLAGDPEGERSAAGTYFPDVAQGEWYDSYINWAAAQGVTAGYGDGTFQPERNMTRQEVVQFLYNFAKSYLGMTLDQRGDLSAFADADQVDDWGREAMSWAVGAGVISSLGAQNVASRAEVATMLYNFTENFF